MERLRMDVEAKNRCTAAAGIARISEEAEDGGS